MAQDIIKNIPLTLDINARKRLNGKVDISLYSKDIATGQFAFTFVDEDGDPVVLDETYSAQALVKYEGSSKTYLNDMTIEGNIIKFIFPHGFITKDGTVTMYIYITKDNYTSDVAAISFPVFLSEIDKDLDDSVVVHYIGKIEQLAEDMRAELDIMLDQFDADIQQAIANADQGPQGEQGIQGIQGKQGIQGEKGDKGLKGDTGDKGDSIEYDWDGTQLGTRTENEPAFNYVDLKGEKGDAGSIDNLDIIDIEDALGFIPLSIDDVPEGIILGEGPIEKGWLFKPVVIVDERNE